MTRKNIEKRILILVFLLVNTLIVFWSGIVRGTRFGHENDIKKKVFNQPKTSVV